LVAGPKLDPRVAAYLVAALAVLAYVSSLGGDFQYDDKPTILRNESVRDPALLAEYFTDPGHFSGAEGNRMYRPALLVTYLANHRISGYDPMVWHLTNVLLHALCAALVTLLAARLVRTLPGADEAGFFPLLAGLAFALHPVHSEVANYVSSRSSSIAAAGFLGALLLHLSWTRGGWNPAGKLLVGGGSVALLLVGLGGKESAVALLPTIFALELLDPAGGRAGRRLGVAAARTAPVLLAVVAYLVVRHLTMSSVLPGVHERIFEVKGTADLYSGAGRSVVENLLTQARVFWRYVGLILFPVDLALDRFVRVSRSPSEPAVVFSAIGILAVVVLALLAARKRPLLTFGAAVFLFGLAPTSTIIPLNVVMNEHRLYLPGTGLALLMAVPAAALVRRHPRAGAGFVVAVALAWVALIQVRNLEWRNEETLWAANVRASPESYRAHNQLGAEYYEQASRLGAVPAALPLLDRAIAEYRIAAELYESYYDPNLNLGMAYRERGRITGEDADYEKAVRRLERCLELRPESVRARYQLATTLGVWGKDDAALEAFRVLAEADRDRETGKRLALYLTPMARIELDRENWLAAEALYRELISLTPDDPNGYVGLAKALVETGREPEAQGVFRQLFERRPDDPKPHLALAALFLELDPPRRAAAAAQYRRALAKGHRGGPAEAARFLGEE